MNGTKNKEEVIQAEVCGIELTVYKVINVKGVEMGEFGSMGDIPMYMRHLIEEGFAEVETKNEIFLM